MGARPEGPMNGGGRSGRRIGRGMREEGTTPMTPEQRQARRGRRAERFSQRAQDFAARSKMARERADRTESNIEAGKGRFSTSGEYGSIGPLLGAGKIALQRERAGRLKQKADHLRSRVDRIESRTKPSTSADQTTQPTSEQVSAPIGYASDGTPVVRSNNDVEPLPPNFGSYQTGTTGIENVTNATPGSGLHRDAAFRGPRNAEHAQRLAERRGRPGGGLYDRIGDMRIPEKGEFFGYTQPGGGPDDFGRPVGRRFPGYTRPGGGVDPSLIGARGPKPPANKERGVKYGDVPRKTGRQLGRSRATRRFR